MADPSTTTTLPGALLGVLPRAHLLALPAEIFQMIYDLAESPKPIDTQTLTPDTSLIVFDSRPPVAAALSQTCKQLQSEMAETLYSGRHFSLMISNDCIRAKYDPQQTPPSLDFLAKAHHIDIDMSVRVDLDFGFQVWALARVVERLVDSKELRTFTLAFRFGTFVRSFDWGKRRALEGRLGGLRRETRRQERSGRDNEMAFAMKVVKVSKGGLLDDMVTFPAKEFETVGDESLFQSWDVDTE